jgi:hypothetical protein
VARGFLKISRRYSTTRSSITTPHHFSFRPLLPAIAWHRLRSRKIARSRIMLRLCRNGGLDRHRVGQFHVPSYDLEHVDGDHQLYGITALAIPPIRKNVPPIQFQHPRNDTPGIGWIYEPVRLSAFWHLKDRRFMRQQLYPRLSRYHRILDVGARGYNQECKALINSTTTEYYQVEPFPPT